MATIVFVSSIKVSLNYLLKAQPPAMGSGDQKRGLILISHSSSYFYYLLFFNSKTSPEWCTLNVTFIIILYDADLRNTGTYDKLTRVYMRWI